MNYSTSKTRYIRWPCIVSCVFVLALLSGCQDASLPARAATTPSESKPEKTASKSVDSSEREANRETNVGTSSEPAAPEPAPDDPQTIAAEPEAVAAVEPQKPVQHWPDKDFLEITFDDVKIDIEKGGDFEDSMLTDKIRQLDGRKIRIKGYMFPPFVRQGLKNFIIVINSNCPFGGPQSYVYHNMMVDLVPGLTTTYPGVDPIVVEGTFSIRPFPDDGSFPELSIYHIGNATVKEL